RNRDAREFPTDRAAAPPANAPASGLPRQSASDRPPRAASPSAAPPALGRLPDSAPRPDRSRGTATAARPVRAPRAAPPTAGFPEDTRAPPPRPGSTKDRAIRNRRASPGRDAV